MPLKMRFRGMSQAGKPTDNPVNEALNGWIREELHIDFQLDQWPHKRRGKGHPVALHRLLQQAASLLCNRL